MKSAGILFLLRNATKSPIQAFAAVAGPPALISVNCLSRFCSMTIEREIVSLLARPEGFQIRRDSRQRIRGDSALAHTAWPADLELAGAAQCAPTSVPKSDSFSATLRTDDVALVKAFSVEFAAIGEPWLLRFAPEELVAKISAIGFPKVLHLTPEKANQRYFQNRRDGLNAALIERMMSAGALGLSRSRAQMRFST